MHRRDRRIGPDQGGILHLVGVRFLQRRPGDFRIDHKSWAAAGGVKDDLSAARLHRIEHVVAVADIDLGLEMRRLEMIVADLEHLPERNVRTGAMPRQIGRRHAERIGLDLKRRLPAGKQFARQRIDFADLLVGHGVAAARRAVAVNHQKPAVAVVGAIIKVGEAGIDRQIIIGVRIHQAGRDRIEALGSLTIAFVDLGAEIARPAADRIDLEQLEPPRGILLPDLELGFFLEDAEQDGRFLGIRFWSSSANICGDSALLALVGSS